jgi:hypothetical protein
MILNRNSTSYKAIVVVTFLGSIMASCRTWQLSNLCLDCPRSANHQRSFSRYFPPRFEILFAEFQATFNRRSNNLSNRIQHRSHTQLSNALALVAFGQQLWLFRLTTDSFKSLADLSALINCDDLWASRPASAATRDAIPSKRGCPSFNLSPFTILPDAARSSFLEIFAILLTD